MPGNAWGARAYGKCHRKQTASCARDRAAQFRAALVRQVFARARGKGEKVR